MRSESSVETTLCIFLCLLGRIDSSISHMYEYVIVLAVDALNLEIPHRLAVS